MSKSGRYAANRIKIEELTASKTITIADCGTLFNVNPAADVTLTLPAAADAGKGWWCEVMADEEDGDTMDNNINVTVGDGTFFTGILCAADGGGGSIGNGTSNNFIGWKTAGTSGELVRIVCLWDRYVAHGFIIDASDTLFADAATNA